MKIALIDYVCDPSNPGVTGLSDEVWDIAGALVRLGHEAHVIGPYVTDNYPKTGVVVHKFPLPPIAYRNIIGHIWILIRAAREMKKLGRVDVVHNPEYVSSAVLSLLCPSIPIIFTEPGNIYERIKNGNPYDWTTTQVYKLAARITAKRCAYCVATSESMAWWWKRTGVAERKIARVPLGIDPLCFARVTDAKGSLVFSEQNVHIVYVARLSRENGPDVTIKAFKLLLGQTSNAILHMVGDGPERNKLLLMTKELGLSEFIIWHGWVDLKKLPIYYSAADVFVFSGFSGGTPRVLLEAMACGAAVVAPAIGGIVDHVKHGETGVLFDAGDHVGMCDRMNLILSNEDLRHSLGSKAMGYVWENLSWDTIVRRFVSLYEKVAF
ncbi:MAG: glycosyltransferase family 4 protein [Bacilli bacterium]